MPKAQRNWYSMKMLADGTPEIFIYDEIGLWGITAQDFAETLNSLGEVKKICLRMNSPGGSVFDGFAIYNMLRRHPAEIEGTVDGIAASICSLIAMACDTLSMPENAFMMVHDPSGGIWGTADDMREFADVMDKLKQSAISAYRNKSGLDDAAIWEMLKVETWLTAAEAVELGLADEIEKPVKMAACLSGMTMSRFNAPPVSLQQIEKEEEGDDDPEAQDDDDPESGGDDDPESGSDEDPDKQESSDEDPEQEDDDEEDPEGKGKDKPNQKADPLAIALACEKAGVPQLTAKMLKEEHTLKEVKQRLSAAGTIRDMCAAAKANPRAQKYIEAGMSVEEVRAELFKLVVARDHQTIDGSRNPDARPAAVIDTGSIYQKYNKPASQRR